MNEYTFNFPTALIHDFTGEQHKVREPVFRRMPDNSFLCLFLTGGPTEPHDRNVVMAIRSEDDGKTWGKPFILFQHSCRGCWATEIFTEGECPFIVLHTYAAESVYRELQTFRSFSYDGGKTWTEPKAFPSGFNGVSVRQGFVMSNGSWAFPIYWQETNYDFDWKNNTERERNCEVRWPMRTGFAVSADKGKTFQRYGYLAADCNLWEPNAVELEDGHIMMFMRATTNLYMSESFDYGKTWSEPTETDIPNSYTKLTVKKIEGKILLISNFHPSMEWQNRKCLQMWVSDDNCKSWSKKISLAADNDVLFYPHAYADDEQKILYITFENGMQHYIQTIPYEEFLYMV